MSTCKPEELSVLCAYLLHQVDTVIPLERLHCHPSGVSELSQVNRLSGVHSAQIDQVLQPLETQRLVLTSEAGERDKKNQTQTKQSEIYNTEVLIATGQLRYSGFYQLLNQKIYQDITALTFLGKPTRL